MVSFGFPEISFRGTFDQLEIADFSAESLTFCVSLGELMPIMPDQVEELLKNFPARATKEQV